MELKVEHFEPIEKIEFNYEEMKAEIEETLKRFSSSAESGAKNLIALKDDRAKLNKLSKSIDEHKKYIKNKLLTPYPEFESKIKTLIGIIQDVTSKIDENIKRIEEEAKKLKMAEITEALSVEISSNHPILFNRPVYCNHIKDYIDGATTRKVGSWLNASMGINLIICEFRDELNRLVDNCRTLENMYADEDEVIKAYITTAVEKHTTFSALVDDINNFKNIKVASEIKKNEEEKQIEQALAKTVIAPKNDKRYTCTIKFIGTEESLRNLKEYLTINNDIAFDIIQSMKEV